jgi:TolB-like protein
VLPLDNLSGDPSQEYFADGMTDSLITTLAQIGALRVISRTSVMRYKGARTSLPEIARELNVEAVVEGTVLRAGERLRIHAQLIDARTDTHLWAEKYERPLGDILVLQSELAQAIATQIRLRLTPEEQARLAGARLVDPKAYDAYLMGRLHWNKRTKEGIEKGLQYFRQSLARDPSYARSHAGVSDCHSMLGFWGWLDPREAFPAARDAALRALRIDETIAEAHTALAWVLILHEWDWEGAARELGRALELNPGYTTTLQLSVAKTRSDRDSLTFPRLDGSCVA